MPEASPISNTHHLKYPKQRVTGSLFKLRVATEGVLDNFFPPPFSHRPICVQQWIGGLTDIQEEPWFLRPKRAISSPKGRD